MVGGGAMTMETHGYPQSEWDESKRDAYDFLVAAARTRRLLSYEELAEDIGPIHFGKHDTKLFTLLDQIFREEHAARRPALTAIVVGKNDFKPGNGFYITARDLGFSFRDKDRFWVSQVRAVFRYWRKK
jgi:hypothetical protein